MKLLEHLYVLLMCTFKLGGTPGHVAASHHLDVLECLLAAKANADLQDKVVIGA